MTIRYQTISDMLCMEAFQQVSFKKKLYPKIILKRLNASLTHPYKCIECQQRFHKVYEATEHYITTHQNSNNLSEKEDKVIQANKANKTYVCDPCNFETKYSQNLQAHFKTQKHLTKTNSHEEVPNFELFNKSTPKIRKSIGDGAYKCEPNKSNKANRNKICRCESRKRKVRCKKCEGCLAQKCNQCKFCLKPSMKKACVKRKCLYQVIPKCQHWIKNPELMMKEEPEMTIKEEPEMMTTEQPDMMIKAEPEMVVKEEHINAKHANLAKAFNCSYCDKYFTSKGNMNRHTKKKH